jgi:hypothetical protein
VAEVLFASIFSTTAMYLLTLKMIKHYWLWIVDGITFRSTVSCAGAWLVWLFLLLLLRHLPQRFFLLLLRDGKVHARDFESSRKLVEHTALVVVAGFLALAGLVRIAMTEWDPRPLLLILPLAWVVFLRKLLALPDKAYKTNRFTQPGPSHVSIIEDEPVSRSLHEAEIDAAEARDRWEHR